MRQSNRFTYKKKRNSDAKRKKGANKNYSGVYSKAIAHAVGFVSRKRPFPTGAQIGLSYAVEKGLFRLNFFRLRIPIVGSSRKTRLFRLEKNSIISTGSSSRKTQSKRFYTCFLNRSHRSSHHQTHTHTATWPHTHTKYPTAVSYKALTLAWLPLLLLLAASQRGAFLVLLASGVYHTTAAARGLDLMLPTMAAPAVALAALG